MSTRPSSLLAWIGASVLSLALAQTVGCGSSAPSSTFHGGELPDASVDGEADGTAGDGPSLISDAGEPDTSHPVSDACTGASCFDGAVCGDGVVEPPETCDDGNSVPGDGCSGVCQVEPGYACPTPGKPCVKVWVCGNGVVDPGETCDDGNTQSGDGCSSTCQIEAGWQCPDTPSELALPPAASASRSVRRRRRRERRAVRRRQHRLRRRLQRDLHARARLRRARPPDMPCVDRRSAATASRRRAARQCDDGNTISGDGCSSTCQVEPGWQCPTRGRQVHRQEVRRRHRRRQRAVRRRQHDARATAAAPPARSSPASPA